MEEFFIADRVKSTTGWTEIKSAKKRPRLTPLSFSRAILKKKMAVVHWHVVEDFVVPGGGRKMAGLFHVCQGTCLCASSSGEGYGKGKVLYCYGEVSEIYTYVLKKGITSRTISKCHNFSFYISAQVRIFARPQ
jgi:hypothetical protein